MKVPPPELMHDISAQSVKVTSAPNRADWLRYCALVAMWGSAFALSKISVAEMSPAIVATGRIWVAVALLYGWMIYRKHRLPRLLPKPDVRWLWFLPVGLSGSALPFLLNAYALQVLDSGLVSILLATMPLFVAALTHFTIPEDRMTLGKIAGLLLGLFGIVLLVGPTLLQDLGGPFALAQIVVLLTAGLYALNSVLIHFMPETPPSVSATGMLLVGALVLTPFAIIDAVHSPMPSLGSLISLLFLGLAATGIGSIFYMQTIRSAGPSFLATSNYFVPPFAVFVGVLFLGESLSTMAVTALMVIFLGIIIERRNTPKQNSPKQSK